MQIMRRYVLAALIQYFDIKVLHISTEMYAVKEHEMKFKFVS